MKKLKCSKCGEENPEGSKFCQDCGNELKPKKVGGNPKRKWALGIIFLIIIIGFAAFTLTFKGTYEQFDDSLVQSVEASVPQDKIMYDIDVSKKLMTQSADIEYQNAKINAENTNKTVDSAKYNHEIEVINEYYTLRVSYVKGEISKGTFLAEAKKVRQELINNKID